VGRGDPTPATPRSHRSIPFAKNSQAIRAITPRVTLVCRLLSPPPTQVMPVNDTEAPPPVRAREILRHYVEHPASADSLEGIAEWLLLEEVVQRRVEETRQALRWLVAQGFLERTTEAVATPPLYRLNADKLADAERLLAP
jgi:hypothetical protein